MKPKNVIIIGAGLAGLACANQLHQAGLKTLVIDNIDVLQNRIYFRPIGNSTTVFA